MFTSASVCPRFRSGAGRVIGFRIRGSPAPGFRYHRSGLPGGVGDGGYSWSRTPMAGDGMGLDLGTQHLNTNHLCHRVYGRLLRCLSE
ncbi:hypothetical protein [uncultured Rikenella sp.]|uniref:hypothetical protein n=1 Tax=uncultured Rikenella sp. TaxID=368003 RepID=UPI002639095D|nr:hypothetical protein [uncultured Rikenella sp.]